MHAKYEVSISYGSKLYQRLKFFATEFQTDSQIHKQKSQKLLKCLQIKFLGYKKNVQTYGQTDGHIYLFTYLAVQLRTVVAESWL